MLFAAERPRCFSNLLLRTSHAYAKYAPAQEDKDSGTDIPIVAIIVTALGAIVAVVGLRYHPAILIVGVVVAAIGGLDIGGIISLF